jgi:hypothetical protein
MVVVHAARTSAELMLAAPLLKHTSVLDLRLHYTGDPDALVATQHILPAPLPGDGLLWNKGSTASGPFTLTEPQPWNCSRGHKNQNYNLQCCFDTLKLCIVDMTQQV